MGLNFLWISGLETDRHGRLLKPPPGGLMQSESKKLAFKNDVCALRKWMTNRPADAAALTTRMPHANEPRPSRCHGDAGRRLFGEGRKPPAAFFRRGTSLTRAPAVRGHLFGVTLFLPNTRRSTWTPRNQDDSPELLHCPGNDC